MKLEDVKLVQIVGQVFKTATESAMATGFIQKLLISSSLSILWSQISELQIIEHLNLFYLKIPATWSTFAEYFEHITNLEFVDTEFFVV